MTLPSVTRPRHPSTAEAHLAKTCKCVAEPHKACGRSTRTRQLENTPAHVRNRRGLPPPGTGPQDLEREEGDLPHTRTHTQSIAVRVPGGVSLTHQRLARTRLRRRRSQAPRLREKLATVAGQSVSLVPVSSGTTMRLKCPKAWRIGRPSKAASNARVTPTATKLSMQNPAPF